MRALVVAPQPFFSARGTPFSVYYRTLVLAQLGVEIDLLTYGQGQNVEIPGVRIVRLPQFRLLGPVRVGPSLLKAFLDAILGAYLLMLLTVNRYDFVHAHEEAIFLCLPLKRIFGFKLVYDMHSSLPQQLTNFRSRSSKVLTGPFKTLERVSLRNSEAVITICPALAEYVLAELDDPKKHFLIENSIFEPVRLIETGEDAPSPIPPGKPLIVYAGTLEPYQGIGLLLRAFRRARRELSDALLLLVGGAAEQVEHYTALARELGIERATSFAGHVSPAVARSYAASADLVVSPRTDGTNTPLKLYEQLANGVPLVATSILSHTQVLSEDVAFLAEPSPEGLARALVRAALDDTARREKASRARELYDSSYSRAAYVSKIRALLGALA